MVLKNFGVFHLRSRSPVIEPFVGSPKMMRRGAHFPILVRPDLSPKISFGSILPVHSVVVGAEAIDKLSFAKAKICLLYTSPSPRDS